MGWWFGKENGQAFRHFCYDLLLKLLFSKLCFKLAVCFGLLSNFIFDPYLTKRVFKKLIDINDTCINTIQWIPRWFRIITPQCAILTGANRQICLLWFHWTIYLSCLSWQNKKTFIEAFCQFSGAVENNNWVQSLFAVNESSFAFFLEISPLF